MQQTNSIISNNKYVELVLENFNFCTGLLAFAALKSGISVAICLPQVPAADYYPELSSYYPVCLKQITSSLRKQNFLLNCSSLFPNLFFPQRVLKFNTSGKVDSRLYMTFDKLIGRDREWATFPINISKYEEYNQIAADFPRGVLVYEYRFDRNWAIIELLRMCRNAGAVVTSNKQKVKADLIINSEPYRSHRIAFMLENAQWPYANSFVINTENILFKFQKVNVNTLVDIEPQISNLEYNQIRDEVLNMFGKLKLQLPFNFDEQLQILLKKYNDNTNSDHSVFGLNTLRKGVENCNRNISKELGKTINIGEIFKPLKSQKMTSEMFRQLQVECEEKYDLAKQTGIDFRAFETLFYRHRYRIDEMIEQAYITMSSIHVPEQIWQKVVQNEQSYFLRSIIN